jgi:L-rhamnose mutarotase
MRRTCFTLQVDPGRLAEYRERHARVWPEMLAALRDAGWRDYSIFLRGDGLLVGYFEAEDPAAAQAAMAASPVAGRWETEMAPFFADGRADETRHVLDEVFNLDAQLTEAGLNGVTR